jgi:hypothetical protein
MSQRDELEFQGGAATKPEAAYGNDGGRIVIMPATVGRWRKNLQPFSALRSFEQAQRPRREMEAAKAEIRRGSVRHYCGTAICPSCTESNEYAAVGFIDGLLT